MVNALKMKKDSVNSGDNMVSIGEIRGVRSHEQPLSPVKHVAEAKEEKKEDSQEAPKLAA
ncbi:TPA: hypothetical protein HA278_01115 [Candidatus Woesearchaeota archaeon]|nr:hypothetical protein [archaeon]HIJ10632.1 hypothetical protein [Candidatus Woesearchaeota archaeon]